MRVLHRDEHLAVVDKPSGLLVHRGMAQDDETAVSRARAALGAFVFPVHRLDRGASGALLFALSSEMAAALQALFEEGTIEKRYLALVRGVLRGPVTVDHPVPKTEGGPRVPAQTEIKLLAAGWRVSLVEARPLTGRFHQIRRHLKHLGHPVLGDSNYGDLRANRAARESFGLARLALHAAGLRFVHPATGSEVAVESPTPDDLNEPMTKMDLAQRA